MASHDRQEAGVKRQRYTEEFRWEAVRLVAEEGFCFGLPRKRYVFVSRRCAAGTADSHQPHRRRVTKMLRSASCKRRTSDFA